MIKSYRLCMTIADLPYGRRQPLRQRKASLDLKATRPLFRPAPTTRPPRERSQRAPADREHTPGRAWARAATCELARARGGREAGKRKGPGLASRGRWIFFYIGLSSLSGCVRANSSSARQFHAACAKWLKDVSSSSSSPAHQLHRCL